MRCVQALQIPHNAQLSSPIRVIRGVNLLITHKIAIDGHKRAATLDSNYTPNPQRHPPHFRHHPGLQCGTMDYGVDWLRVGADLAGFGGACRG
jgi:hypothetical protein